MLIAGVEARGPARAQAASAGRSGLPDSFQGRVLEEGEWEGL